MAKEIHQSIVINAKVKTTLENMNQTITQLQDDLRKGITNLDMSKGVGNSLSKTLSTFQDEFKRFSDLTKSGKLEFMDSKEALRSGEKIIEKYREIQRVVGNLSDLQIADAKKLFPDAFKKDVDDLSNKLGSLKQNLGNLEAKGLEVTQAETKLTALKTQVDELKSKLIDEKPLEISVEDANKKLKTAQDEVEKIRNALKEELRLKLDAADANVTSVKGQIEKIEKARAARDTSKLAIGERGQVTYEGKTSTQWKQSGASKEQISAAQAAIQAYAAEERQLTSLRNALKDVTGDADRLREAFTGFGEKTDLTKIAAMLGQSAGQIDQTKNALDNQAQATKEATQAQEKLNQAQNENKTTTKNITQTTKDIAEQEQKITKLQAQYTQLFGKIDVSKLEQGLQKTLGKDFTPDMLKNKDGIEQLLTKLRETDQADFEKLKTSLVQLGVNADTAEDYVRQLREGLSGIKNNSADISRASQEMEMLKNRVLYFFSMTNSVQLFRRAVTKALNTVKELDKTMTEAAVVTEFSVGDMWDKLPTYAKEAQKLGVSINGMYQATTLYYQQGLKTNEAMALGVETMKMARIASMDSTEATTAMTAALRGFNMELNETSATRVNDVYSQLAAVTAADTNQIATAMKKTASIAASANMEFETTAALLAQIIETTQEAPETAGTAMKTIIARFSEVKSLRERGETTGKDEEGEAIDVNKIQTALRSVGISMEGFFAGTEGLDSILLKLAEKWSTLDVETQRYIATMAAGSRQQSRFLAMMSDYSRTTELVGEAQNSAGASARQFEKTLESMESKLQRLDNAWNEFLMGLANNEVLKGAVDLITSLVTGINELTNKLSGGNGLLKSFVSLMTTLGGLSMGKAFLSGGLGWVGRQMGMKNTEPQTEKMGFAGRKTQASQQQGGRKILGFMSNKEVTKNAQQRRQQFLANRFKKENRIQLKNDKNITTQDQFETALRGTTKGIVANDKALSAAKDTWQKTFDATKDTTKATEAATKAYEENGGKLLSSKQAQVMASKTTKQLGVDYKALGGAVMGAGAAFGGLAILLSAVGLDEAAEDVGKISGILMGLGAIISFLGPAIQGLAGKIAAAGVTAGMAWAWAFAIVGLVTLLIVGITTLGSKAKSAAEEMEELETQTKALAEAADKAEESIQNIADTQKDLANLQSTMSGLIKGTNEWNQALIKSNNKVLELLEAYPELSEYITEENGLLKIGAEGWNIITKKQMEAYANASTAKLALQAKKTVVAGEIVSKDSNLLKGEKEAQNKALAVQGQIQVNEFYRQVAAADPGLKDNEFSEYSAAALAAQGLEEFTNQLDETVDTLKINEEAYQEYADIMGITLKEAKEEDKTVIKNTLAAVKIQEKSASRMRAINSRMAGLSKEDKELAKVLLSKNGSKITDAQINDLTDEKIKELGDALELTKEEMAGLNTIVGQVRTSFDTLEAKIGEIGINDNLAEVLRGANYQISYGITTKIAELQEKGIASTQINSWFDNLLEGRDQEQKAAILETLAITDWHSIEDLNNTFSMLIDKGLLDPTLAEGLESTMKDLTGAISDNTTAQNQQKGFQLKEILSQLLSGELTNVMTTEQMNDLIDTGKFKESDFQQVGIDEWVYNGDLYAKVVTLYGDTVEKMESNTTSNSAKAEKGKALQGILDKDYNFMASFVGTTFEDFDSAKIVFDKIAEQNSEYADLSFDTWFKEKSRYSKEDWEAMSEGRKEEVQEAYLEYLNDKDTDLIKQYNNDVNARPSISLTGGEALNWLASGGKLGGTDEKGIKLLDNLGNDMADILGETYPVDGTLDERRQWILDKKEEYLDAYSSNKAQAETDIATQATSVGSYYGTTASYGYLGGQLEGEEAKDLYAENYEKGIETRFTYYGGSAFLGQITENMDPETITEYDLVIKTLASDLGNTAKRVKTFSENMANLEENLDSTKRGTFEYGQAQEQAYANIGALFGKDAKWARSLNLSDEILEGLAKGDTKYFNALTEKAKESALEGLEDIDWGENIDTDVITNKLSSISAIVGLSPDDASYNEYLNFFNSLGEDGRKAFAWMASLDGITLSFEYDENGTVTSFLAGKSDLSTLFGNYHGGSRGGGGSSSKWENPYDEFYNTVAKINEELRTREKIELRYQRLLDRHAATAEKLAQLSRDQITSLETERADREYLLAGRERQMRDIEAEYSDLDEYARYNEQTRQVEINWDLIEKLDGSSNEKLTSRIEEYISKLEEQEGMIEEEIDALDEIQDAVWEIYEQGKEDYLDLEDQIKEAIIGARQREIDKLSEINDSINDTNSKLIDSMQKQIDQYRQNRENERTEEEISDKQRRLAYLQQDTSGANALEIMKLQEEIDKAQEDYTDTLIDQKISELQDQNDQAAEQRQRQIDIMQAQLEHYEQSGQVWQDVHALMREGLSKEDGLMRGSKLEEILKGESGFEAMSHIEKMDWLNELEGLIAQGLGWLEGGGMLGMYGQGATVTFKNADGQEVTGVIDEHGNVIADGQIYSGKNFFSSTDGKLSTTQTGQEATDAYLATLKPEEPENKPTNPRPGEKKLKGYNVSFNGKTKTLNLEEGQSLQTKAVREELLKILWEDKDWAEGIIDELNDENTYVSSEDIDNELIARAVLTPVYSYKTGGLADFTGPAWLDGTKSRPEYILNADQTKSFFQLVDVLSSLRSGTSQTTQNSGDNTYDIDINVESIGSDYDVEQLANTVKRLINEDARYRNNNAINLMR